MATMSEKIAVDVMGWKKDLGDYYPLPEYRFGEKLELPYRKASESVPFSEWNPEEDFYQAVWVLRKLGGYYSISDKEIVVEADRDGKRRSCRVKILERERMAAGICEAIVAAYLGCD